MEIEKGQNMTAYRIMYTDNQGIGRYVDVEGTNLGVVIWNVAQEIMTGHLVDTMILPSKENAYNTPYHAEAGPTLDVEP